jgi:hypothetical protein
VIDPWANSNTVVQEHVQAPLQPHPVVPAGPIDYDGQQYEEQQGHYLGQYDEQHGHYLGQYDGPFPVAAPPASPGLLGQLTAEAPSDNMSMSMVEFMSMLDEQPAEMVNEQPAETYG